MDAVKEKKSIKTVIADSQFLTTESLKSLLSRDKRFSIVDVVSTMCELNKIIESNTFNLLIIDPTTIDLNGYDILKEIKKKHPQLWIVVLTNSITKIEFYKLIKNNIEDIIYKTANSDDIIIAINNAIDGKKYFAREVLEMFIELVENKYKSEEYPAQLTNSEIEIVHLIARGLTTKEIATRRNISFHTVNTHRKNIFRKMSVSNVAELIGHATKAGWINSVEVYA